MIVLLCDSPTPRLRYAADILFSAVLGLTVELQNANQAPDFQANKLYINYSAQNFNHIFRLPNCGLLAQKTIDTKLKPTIQSDGYLPRLLFTNDNSFDPLSAIFWLAVEYEHYQNPTLDAHLRYKDPAPTLLQTRPICHEWASRLLQEITTFLQNSGELEKANRLNELAKEKAPVFSEEFTFDIDHPWLFLNKGIIVEFGGIIKSALKLRLGELKDRLSAQITGKDPNFSFDFILKHIPADKLTFFWLMGGTSGFDNRFNPSNKQWVRLIEAMQKQGVRCGLHPSYNAAFDAELMAQEKKTLETILDTPVTHSRQHFLRYQLPETYRNLESVGLTDDYTTCAAGWAGFKHGLAAPFPWFDLSQNRISDLTLHPTHLMDRTFQKYESLSPEAARRKALAIREQCRSAGGKFVPLFHNDSVSNYGEWAGWREKYFFSPD